MRGPRVEVYVSTASNKNRCVSTISAKNCYVSTVSTERRYVSTVSTESRNVSIVSTESRYVSTVSTKIWYVHDRALPKQDMFRPCSTEKICALPRSTHANFTLTVPNQKYVLDSSKNCFGPY